MKYIVRLSKEVNLVVTLQTCGLKSRLHEICLSIGCASCHLLYAGIVNVIVNKALKFDFKFLTQVQIKGLLSNLELVGHVHVA